MSKIVERKLGFEASPSPDVVGYKLYYREDGAGEPLTYEDFTSDLEVPVTTTELNGKTIYVISLNDILPDVEGSYRFGISAYDAAGNEADIVEIVMDLDSVAPEPVPFLGDVS